MVSAYRQQLMQRLAQQALDRQQAAQQIIQDIDILQECLPYQLDFILHPSKRKCICSTRRSGKSFCLALYLISEALRIPKGKFIYMGLTNESAKRTMWSDIFETIILKYDLHVELNSKLEMIFPNGSVIYLGGLDATPKQMHKLRGQRYHLAVIDECQDFSQDLKQIIQSVLKMALAQTAATLCLAGTPGNSQGTHYWWLINKPESEETEWNRFFFDWRDNSKVDPISGEAINVTIQAACDADIVRNPLIVNTPEWKQEIDGQWDITTSARIYRYESVNNIMQLPDQAWFSSAHKILGLDLGFSPDPNAFTITAYNLKYDNNFYVIKSWEQGNMSTQELAMEIKRLHAIYRFKHIVADAGGMGKQIVHDLNTTYGLYIESADKYGKLAHQNMLNSDFITQQVFIYAPDNTELIKQLLNVIWDRKALLNGEKKEDKRFANHCTDSLLYNHFFSRHQWYKAPKPVERHWSTDDFKEKLTRDLIKRNKKNNGGFYNKADFATAADRKHNARYK